MATKFVTFSTNYNQLGAMFRSVKKLQSQAFDMRASPHTMQAMQHLSKVWFHRMLARALRDVLRNCITYTVVVRSCVQRDESGPVQFFFGALYRSDNCQYYYYFMIEQLMCALVLIRTARMSSSDEDELDQSWVELIWTN